jgi:hypothetical protein
MLGVSADHLCWCHRLNSHHLRRGEAKIVLPPENKGIGRRKSTFGGQNANSPDHNPDDLGVFKPVNDRIADENDRLYADLKAAVNHVWDDIPCRMLHNIIRLLPECIKETIRKKGGNFYKIPHTYDSDSDDAISGKAADEQDWKDEDPYNPERAAVWKEAPDGPVSYVSIPSVWPADWCDSDEEDPGLVGDISAVTGDGSAAAAARERHQIEFEMDADSVEEGDDMGNGASDEGEAAGSGSGAE